MVASMDRNLVVVMDVTMVDVMVVHLDDSKDVVMVEN